MELTSETIIQGIKLRMNKARTDKKMSAFKLAPEIGVGWSMIYRWESLDNEVLPRVENLVKFCKSLDVSTDYVLLGKE